MYNTFVYISCFLYDSFQQFVDQRVNNGWDFELLNPKYLEFAEPVLE